MQRFALAAALLMPVVIDGAFTPVPAKLISEVLIAQDKKSDSTPLAIKDIDRLSKKVKQAIAAGDYQKAIEITKSILQLQEKELGAEHLDTAYSLNSLAIMYVRQNLYSKAEPLYLRAISIYENAKGLEHTDTAITLGNLAHMYSEQGLYNTAEPLYLRALAITEKVLGAEHLGTALNLNSLALLYQDQGLYNKAEPLYIRALAIMEKVLGPEHLRTSISLNNLALLYQYEGLYGKAESLIRRALAIEFTLIQRQAPYLALSDRQRFVNNLGYTDEIAFSAAARGDSGVKLAFFSRLNRQGLLEEIEKRQAQLAALPGPQQEISEELRAVTQQLASVSLIAKQRQSLSERKEELEKQLYRLLPELQPRLVEVQQVAAVLPDDSVLIEFQRYQPFDGSKPDGEQLGEARYMALLLKADGEIEHVDLGLAIPVEQKIQQALRASEGRSLNAQELWVELGELVIRPLAKATAGTKTWFISPDGELNRIPFAALSMPTGDELLVEAVQLRLLTTGRELLDLAKSSDSDQAAQKPLVVANPNFDHSKQSLGSSSSRSIASKDSNQQRSGDLESLQWLQLPGTEKEGNAITQLIDAQLLMGEKATALAVQQQETPKVLHLASHAYYLADQEQGDSNEQRSQQQLGNSSPGDKSLQAENPLLRSGIVLAGANQPEANSKDDGYLTALEVAKLDWQGTEMVVISACESGKGDIQAGDGVYGLKRAIAVAGARSSLLSLWKVDDAATAAFMQSFYQRLKAGEGRADALAATQKEFRNHPIAGWRHPYVWAAFQLSGDWRPVQW